MSYLIRYFLFFIISACTIFPAVAQDQEKPVSTYVNQAWKVTWSRFYRNDTHLFYDYLTSYEKGHELDHLPTAIEVKRQFPNECGYGTGMEDCMISAGVMLSVILDRYSVTREESLKKEAHNVFRGIRLSATAHGVDGFLARGVCHEDLKSIYLNSSRDQYTHVVHALWEYVRSPLCDKQTKNEIIQIVTNIADRMTKNVIPENDYDSLRADGSRDTRGISRMWNVKGHEAARLPMIYAVAWDLTKKTSYHDLWRKYITEAVRQSHTVEDWQPTYAFLQMQISLELLAKLEPDPKLKTEMIEIMNEIGSRCAKRAIQADQQAEKMDLTMFCTNWRTDVGLDSKGSYRPVWYIIREGGEAALAQMVADVPFPKKQEEILERSLKRLDYDRVSSNGIFFLQGAYWKQRARELQ